MQQRGRVMQRLEPRSCDTRSQIREKALRIGFDAVGFCKASLGPEVRERLNQFIQSGFYGDMGWLAARSEQRSHPQCLWPEARSVIVVGLSYAPKDDPLDVISSAKQRSHFRLCPEIETIIILLRED